MKRKRILIVDDDKSFLDELKDMLVLNDYLVDVAADAAEIVKIADEKRPDIIFLDMRMPGKSGFQVADDLKHFHTTEDIPIVAMTGNFTEKHHISFMKSIGISDCIIKPSSPEDILSKIVEFTGKCHGLSE